MSDEIFSISAEQLPDLPEIQLIEPIVQCGVLYLGTAIPSPGRRGLDSIQEPLSHRYPVDGINTVRGIDSVLSVYDNGIQLTFARQPHVVIFFPISSLIYCAALRFSIVENDQGSSLDWRFITLDSTIENVSKHPPLFCAVVQRTQILSGDECHCFITKSDDAALALVRTISEIYGNLKPNVKPYKAPIFYQLDRYGRKITETSGIIYLSPDIDDDYQLNQTIDRNKSLTTCNQNCLLDPTSNGFFYRTNASIIEQWQLWDDDDLIGSRPRPPASPFGQHQGLYHDDLTKEMHQYFNHMDNEEHSSSCSCSNSSDSSIKNHSHRRIKRKSRYDTDQLITSFSHPHPSSFNPSLLIQNNDEILQNNIELKRSQQAPIIIEKVMPNPLIAIPQTSPNYSIEQSHPKFNYSIPTKPTSINYTPYSNTYDINERGEKITKEGNRILFMDVIQPNIINNEIEPQPYITPTHRSRSHQRRQRRQSRHIPVIDIRSIDGLINSKKPKQRQKNIVNNNEEKIQDQHLKTSDLLEIVEGYFEDYKGRKLKLDGHGAQTLLNHLESSSENKHQSLNDFDNEKSHHRRRRSHSMLTSGPSVNYGERSPIKLISQQESNESQQQQQFTPSIYNNEQVNEYVSNVYGTIDQRSQKTESSINQNENQISYNTNVAGVTNENYISPYRYMQSSINPMLFHEYHNTYGRY